MWMELLGVGLVLGGAAGIWHQVRKPTKKTQQAPAMPAPAKPRPLTPPPPPPDMVRFSVGDYDAYEPIGSGGMARVYLGRHRIHGNQVAIKVVRDDLAGDQEFQARFQREIELSKAIVHPNVVRVFDSGFSGKHLYLVMEFVEGPSLEDVLKKGPVARKYFLLWATQLASALAAAHQRQLVHRDIKSANVMVSSDGAARLLDFGLALQSGQERFTSLGFSMGTPAYMAPEVLTKGSYSPATDQYALGILFYEMLAGELPFHHKNPMEMGMLHVTKAPPPMPASARPMDSVIMRMLAKDPAQRYGSLTEVQQALERL